MRLRAYRIAAVRSAWIVYVAAGIAFPVYLFGVIAPLVGTFGIDAYAYWSAAPPLYERVPPTLGSYLYSPAFYQLTEPLRLLDWAGFQVAWTALQLGTALWLGPFAALFPGTSLELYHGNIHILLAGAIVAGFRYPWAWAFVLHTKPTVAIGLLWFVVRRDWRALRIAIGAAAGVALVSYAVAPSWWHEYVGMLLTQTGARAPEGMIPVPVFYRLPVAAAIVVWGARADRRWTLPLAGFVALPNMWWHGLGMLAGVFAWRNSRDRLDVARAELAGMATADRGSPVPAGGLAGLVRRLVP